MLTYLLGAPLWLWQCVFGSYLLAEILYYFQQKILPYQGQMRWLAFPELAIFAFADFTEIIPSSLIISLRYGQLFLLLFAGDYLEKPNLFRIVYWPVLILSLIISHVISEQNWLAITFATVFHASLAFALSMAAIECRKKHCDKLAPSLFSPISPCAEPLEVEFDHCRRLVFEQMKRCYQVTRHLCQPSHVEVLSQNLDWYGKVQNALEAQARMIVALELALAQSLLPIDLCKQLKESVLLTPFLEKHLQSCFFAICAELDKKKKIILRQQPPKLQLHWMDKIPQRIELAAAPLWRWIVQCWLRYLMAKGNESIKVLVSEDQHRNCLLKGIAEANIEKICHRLEGVRCPLCMKRVRSLYHFPAISETACRECMKCEVESKLRQDWEIRRSALGELKLATRLVSLFRLGYIQCGIHHWDRWEYFVTLGIHRM